MFEEYTGWWAARQLRVKGRPPAEKTLACKGYVLRRLAALAGAEGDHPEYSLAMVVTDRAAVERLLDCLYACHAPGTVIGDVATLTQFGEWAVAKGWIDRVAVSSADRPRWRPQKPIVVYSEAEVARLLLFAEARGNVRFHLLLATVAHTGRRVGEILGLRYVDVILDSEIPHFNLPTTKNAQQAYVPLNAALRELWTSERMAELRALPTKGTRSAAVFPFPSTYSTNVDSLQILCKRSGVPYRGFHCFRHTKATQLIARGVPIQAVSAVLGHASISTTDRVYHHATALDYARYLDA